MSSSFTAYVSGLFGQHERSDCSVVFYCSSSSSSGCSSSSCASANAADRPQGQATENAQADNQLAYLSPEDSAGLSAMRMEPRTTRKMAKRRKTVETQTGPDGPEPLPAGSVAVGAPLPAHTMVICGGSQRFRAQVDRWSLQGQQGGSCSSSRPILRVPLDHPDELPHALAAVRFMYTGKLDVSEAASLLRVRRQAAYLQVEGGTEACERALSTLLTAPQPVQQQPQSPQQQQQRQSPQQRQAAGALVGVVQLYCCWDLVSCTDMEPAVVQRLLSTCREQLVKHAGAALGKAGASALAGGPVLMGELLAWAFGDAPSLMSREDVRKQMEALPAAAMEALLGADSFATDSESTVLLVLLRWLGSNSCKSAVRQRLLKLVRLAQLSDTYLLRLLPLLPTLHISPQELRFLQEYSLASSDRKKTQLRQAAKKHFEVKACAWYCTAPRPAPRWEGGARSYEWSVDAGELRAGLDELSEQDAVWVYGEFAGGATPCIVANGISWFPCIVYGNGKDTAGVYLSCKPPAVLRVDLAAEAGVLARPGPCRMVVYKWGGEGGERREEAWSKTYKASDLCELGSGLGSRRALPLSSAPPSPSAAAASGGQGAAGAVGAPAATASAVPSSPSSAAAAVAPPADDPLLSRWAPYIKDGRLWGSLSWEAPK
ncbi:hypothetical protein PLESTB_001800200 [Pleodorina starrii]|uniref:BACK domain-containing protein n=1 Tax=Pleodorina starrii TaxID=330485 RepID=A0A9W6C1H5_9CHLO|nr:hypothetical protein PLESTB_001800200 [Pleodorina starrii]GLC67920.1 hypothetical protein PLESTF_000623100 [Pleodorina starrii]